MDKMEMESDPKPADHGNVSVERTPLAAHVMPYATGAAADMLLVLEGENGQYATNLSCAEDGALTVKTGLPIHVTDETVRLSLRNGVFTVSTSSFEIVADTKPATVAASRHLIEDFSAHTPRIPMVKAPTTPPLAFDDAPVTTMHAPPVREPGTRCGNCGELFHIGTRPWAADYPDRGESYHICDGCGRDISDEIANRLDVEAV